MESTDCPVCDIYIYMLCHVPIPSPLALSFNKRRFLEKKNTTLW